MSAGGCQGEERRQETEMQTWADSMGQGEGRRKKQGKPGRMEQETRLE